MWFSFGVDEYFQLRKRFFSECFYSTLVFIDLDIMSLHFLGKCAYQELSSFKKIPEKFFRMWLISLSCFICQKTCRFKKCLYKACKATARSEFFDAKACRAKAKLAFLAVMGVGCQPYKDAQKEACECVKSEL